jgi:CheY-like chemotaxis protein
MHRLRLIHANTTEGEKRAEALRSAGYDVAFDALGPRVIRDLKENPPAAIVIDLSRAPSQGRDLGLAIRQRKATRHVPVVFVDGDPEKLVRLKEILPDAVYATWGRIGGALERAIARPPTDPVVPKSLFAGYSGTPLAKKLGIKTNSVVALVGAPDGFEKTLGKLPDGVTIRGQARGRPDLTVWFTRSRKDLENRIGRMTPFGERDGLWIAWPKKTSELSCDLTQTVVREIGLAAGLVDYKVCKIDETWAGLRFTVRK